jgi:hypothetical protein
MRRDQVDNGFDLGLLFEIEKNMQEILCCGNV